MIVENSFPGDPRVRKEAFTLKEAGYKINIIALNKKFTKSAENVDGIKVYRIPVLNYFKRIKQNHHVKILNYINTIISYFAQYLYFTTACFLVSVYVLFKDGFDVIHIHNPPDTLSFIGAFYRVFGKKFIFDQHEHTPELYLSRYGLRDGYIYRILYQIEKFYLKTADLVIATNESYKALNIKRSSIKSHKIHVVRNGPDINESKVMPPQKEFQKINKTIVAFMGAINPQDGVDYLVRAFHHLVFRLNRKDLFCLIIGSGDSLPELKLLSEQLRISEYFWFTGHIPHEDVMSYLSAAAICVEPAPADPFNEISTPIKVMEYMAIKKPVVCFDLPEIRYTAKDAASYVTPNDEAELANTIRDLADDPEKRRNMGQLGYTRIINHLAWHHVSSHLISAYNSVLRNHNGYSEI